MIPFSRPCYSDEDKKAFLTGLEPTSGGDRMRLNAEDDIRRKFFGAGDFQVLVTNSATSALILAGRLFGGSMAQTFHVPSLSWYSTWSWIPTCLRKHYDVSPWIGGPSLKSDTVGANDVAVLVDLWGRPKELDAYLSTSSFRCPVIVDSSHALGEWRHAEWLKSDKVQAIVYSFNSVKQCSAVRGGALVFRGTFATKQRLRAWSDSGSIGRNGWEPEGFNAEMGEPNALLLRSQLTTFWERQERCKAILSLYRDALSSRPGDAYAYLRGDSGHLAVLVMVEACSGVPGTEVVSQFRTHAQKNGFRTGHHYPLARYLSPIDFPHAHILSESVVTIPLWSDMKPTEVRTVCKALKSFKPLHQ